MIDALLSGVSQSHHMMNDDAVSAARTGALADTGDARATERNTPTNAIILFIIHPIG
ncbi:hypothetical protein [uncultured Sphingomonas sp.]|uniref:hypothetical protein n=1 Tax=uncultured Sphingomonas sp. TaxID=158754 RepID=UPI0025FC237F|nr:hypothetical protein [uncultured Sphingomonas sp.]